MKILPWETVPSFTFKNRKQMIESSNKNLSLIYKRTAI